MPQALTRGAAAPCCTDLSSPQMQELSPELSRGNCQHLLRIRNSEKKRQDGIQNKLKALKPLAPPPVPNWCLAAEELAPSELDAAEIFLTWAHHRPPSLPCSEQHMAATAGELGRRSTDTASPAAHRSGERNRNPRVERAALRGWRDKMAVGTEGGKKPRRVWGRYPQPPGTAAKTKPKNTETYSLGLRIFTYPTKEAQLQLQSVSSASDLGLRVQSCTSTWQTYAQTPWPAGLCPAHLCTLPQPSVWQGSQILIFSRKRLIFTCWASSALTEVAQQVKISPFLPHTQANFRKLWKNHSLLIVLFFLFFFCMCGSSKRKKNMQPAFHKWIEIYALRLCIDLHTPLLGIQAVQRTEVGHFDHLYCIIKLYISF